MLDTVSFCRKLATKQGQAIAREQQNDTTLIYFILRSNSTISLHVASFQKDQLSFNITPIYTNLYQLLKYLRISIIRGIKHKILSCFLIKINNGINFAYPFNSGPGKKCCYFTSKCLHMHPHWFTQAKEN